MTALLAWLAFLRGVSIVELLQNAECATSASWRLHRSLYPHSSRQGFFLSSRQKHLKGVGIFHHSVGIQRTAGRSAVLNNFTNSSARCHATGQAPCLIGTKVPIRQDGPPHDVQTHITEKQRVENRHVGGSD